MQCHSQLTAVFVFCDGVPLHDVEKLQDTAVIFSLFFWFCVILFCFFLFFSSSPISLSIFFCTFSKPFCGPLDVLGPTFLTNCCTNHTANHPTITWSPICQLISVFQSSLPGVLLLSKAPQQCAAPLTASTSAKSTATVPCHAVQPGFLAPRARWRGSRCRGRGSRSLCRTPRRPSRRAQWGDRFAIPRRWRDLLAGGRVV